LGDRDLSRRRRRGRNLCCGARLGVSPAAVSQQLAGLEAALGAVLLDRSTRPMIVTPAGTMFRRHAQTILNAADEARADLASADLAGLKTLRLGMIEDFEADVTPHLLSALSQDLAGCRFTLETGPSHRLLDLLESRALDVIVATELAGPIETGWREVHPILRDPFIAVGPRGRSIDGLPLIQYTARHLIGRQIAQHLARHGQTPASRFELDSYHAILAMVAAGAGWAILTPLALHQARRFRDAVEVHPLPFTPFDRTLSLSARAGNLRDIPAQITLRLKSLIETEVVAPMRIAIPFLGESLRIL
jgi:DNA-binding transcriptional LysR family regulator